MKKGMRVAVSIGSAAMLLGMLVQGAAAYAGQIPQQVTVGGPATVSCGSNLSVSATVTDSHGARVDNQQVVWSFGAGQQAGDTIGTVTTTTDANGVATTTVRLGCVLGSRTVVATAGPASGQVLLPLSELVGGVTAGPTGGTGGLPPTSTAGDSPISWPSILAVFAILMALVLVGLRRRSSIQ
jgi:hypothetical protein